MKSSTQRYSHIFNIAFEAVLVNKFRSLLTALGIIFGVAAVIAMLAIGNGAKQEIIEQMKLIGVNNIVIRPMSADKLMDQQEEAQEEQNGEIKKNFSPGLNLNDLNAIKNILPTIELTSPEVTYQTYVTNRDTRNKAQLTGINNSFFDIFKLNFIDGNKFSKVHIEDGSPVCIIGKEIATKIFKDEKPIGKWLKCDHLWLKVIGLLEHKTISSSASENLGVTNYNKMIFAPVKTVLLRYKNRGKVKVHDANMYYSSRPVVSLNKNQLDKIVVQIKETSKMKATANIIERLLLRRHNQQKDFEIIIPELLLKQEQRTRDIFNIVLGAIASISLIVGGIGIMNIMLASVTERTKEIGIRLAIGAKKKDVAMQFLAESTMISVSGGFLGIILGALLAQVISKFAEIPTIISAVSILVSFGVSATVGIIFGYMPAKKAAEKDPVTSLRYE